MKTTLLSSFLISSFLCINAQANSGLELKELFYLTDQQSSIPVDSWLPSFAKNFSRGIAVSGNNLYIPVRGTEELMGQGVYRLNATTGQYISTLPLDDASGKRVITGGDFLINDVVTSEDGAIYVCNMAIDARLNKWVKETEKWMPNKDGKLFKIYKYATPESFPEEFLSFDASAHPTTQGTAKNNILRFGDGITFSGSSQQGRLIAVPENSGLRDRCYEWSVKEGALSSADPQVIFFHNEFEESAIKPGVGKYGRVYTGFEQETYIEKGTQSGDSEIRPRQFKIGKRDSKGWAYAPLCGMVSESNALRNGLGNTAYPFSYGDRKYLACVDYANAVNGSADARGVIIDVTDFDNSFEVFRTPRSLGNQYLNGTDGVAVKINKDGFNVYFLSSKNGIAAYSYVNPNVGIEEISDNRNFGLSIEADRISFSEKIRSVKIYQIQSGMEIASDTDCSGVTVNMKGAFLVRCILSDGHVVNKRVIL
ncbi:MAG: hypothetical protein RR346_01860 [Bacteroidales bacterium]